MGHVTTFRCEFNCGVYLVIRLTIFGNFSILQCVTSLNMGHVTVFRCEFNHGFYLVIRPTIFGNFSILQCVTSFNIGHVMVFWCGFNGGVYLVIRLIMFSNFSKCAIYVPPGPVCQCEFNHDVYFHNIWYGHHLALFFSADLAVTVILLSGDYIS
jgi:hypothetical protein